MDLSVAWDFQQAVSGLKIAVYACPSDPQSDRSRDPGGGRAILYPTNYGFSYGPWFVYDPQTGQGGSGAFFPNSKLDFAAFTDGTSNTLLISEVRTWQPYRRNGGPPTTVIPESAAAAGLVIASAPDFRDTGHTEWPDGRVHHAGFTTTLAPNAESPCPGSEAGRDCDYNSWQEGRNGRAGRPTYAIVTSRSYHSATVNSALADGSVRSISDNIDLSVWRALSTRAGAEIANEF